MTCYGYICFGIGVQVSSSCAFELLGDQQLSNCRHNWFSSSQPFVLPSVLSSCIVIGRNHCVVCGEPDWRADPSER